MRWTLMRSRLEIDDAAALRKPPSESEKRSAGIKDRAIERMTGEAKVDVIVSPDGAGGQISRPQ